MMLPDSKEFKEILYTSAALRGTGQFLDAINCIEQQIVTMHSDCLLNAYLEIFLSAKEGNLSEKTYETAKELSRLEPGLPSIQSYL